MNAHRLPSDWLRVLNPEVTARLGHIRHAPFDFDGTLSVLREGWEGHEGAPGQSLAKRRGQGLDHGFRTR